MASVVTCPKCHTRLKLNKAPEAAARIQCPHCRHPFAIAGSNGVTAKTPAPHISRADLPEPKSRDERSRKRPLIGTGMGIAILLAVLLAGGGITTAILTRPAADSLAGANNGTKPPTKSDDKAAGDRKPDEKKPDESSAPDKEKLRKEHLEHARKHLKDKKLKEALANFNKVLEMFPDDPDAKIGRVNAQKALDDGLRKREAELAQQKAKELEEKRQKDLAALIKTGQDSLEMNQLAKAEDAFKKALDIAPGNNDATRGLLAVREAQAQAELNQRYDTLLTAAKSSLQAGRYAEALRDATAAQQVMPTNAKAVAAALEVAQQAEQQLTMLKGQDERKQAYAKVMDQGASALRERRFPEAMESYKVALKLVPEDPAAAKGLADAELGAKQFIAEFALLQNQYQALMNQGKLAMGAGAFVNAVQCFTQAVQLMPNDPNARAALLEAQGAVGRAVAYQTAMEQGRTAMIAKSYGDAFAAYSNALSSVPNDPFALQAREDARRLLLGTIQTKQIVDERLLAAALRLKQKEWAAARDLYTDAVKIMPDNPENVNIKLMIDYTDAMAKGEIAAKTRNHGEAVKQYFAALIVQKNDPLAGEGMQKAMVDGQQMYDDSMAKGKKSLDGKDFPAAAAGFGDALRSLPDVELIDVQFPQLPQARAAAKTGFDEAQRLRKARYDDDVAKASLAMNVKNFPEAIAQFTDALRMLPNDPLASQGLNDAQRLFQDAQRNAAGDLARNFDAGVKAAEQLLSLQKYAEASKAFNDAIQLQPKDPSVAALQIKARFADAMARGQSAMDLKSYAAAVAAFNDALKQLPDNAQAVQARNNAQMLIDNAGLAAALSAKVKQGDQLLNLKQYAQASSVFNDALKLQPGNDEVLRKIRYADAMVKGLAAKTAPDALAAYTDALNAKPGDPIALKGQQDAQSFVQKMANAGKDFDAKARLGDQLLATKQYSGAAKAFSDAINLMPADPRVADLQKKATFATAMAQAQSAMMTNQYANAISAYKLALDQMSDPTAAQGLLDAQQRLKMGQAAQQIANKIKEANGSLSLLKYVEAGRAFNEAIALLPPGDPQVPMLTAKAAYANAMASARQAMGLKDFNSAAAFYNAALKAQPLDFAATKGLQDIQAFTMGAKAKQDYDARIGMGNLSLSQKKYAEAGNLFRDAARILPSQALAANRLASYADSMARGQQAMGISNFKDAIAAFSDARLTAPPGDMTAQFALQDAQQKAGAGTVTPPPMPGKDYDAKMAQAQSLVTQKRYAEARDILLDAVNLNPTKKEAQVKYRYADAMAKGTAAVNSKMFKAAVGHFENALAAIPNDPVAVAAWTNAKKGK